MDSVVYHTLTLTHTCIVPLGSDLPAIPVMLLRRQTGFVILPRAGVMSSAVTVACVFQSLQGTILVVLGFRGVLILAAV